VVGWDSDSKLIVATIALVVLVSAVAMMVANVEYFDLGEGGEPLGPKANAVAELLAYTLVPIFIFLALWLLLSSRKGKGMREKVQPKPGSGIAGFIVILMILGAVIVFAALTDGQIFDAYQDPQDQNDPGGEGEPEPVVTPDGGQGSLLIGAFLIVIIVLALGGGRKYLRKRPVLASRAATALEMKKARAIVDKAVEDLYAGEDARSVIVRAYQRMSRLISGRLQDAPYLTPRELASLAEERFGWPRKATDELTSLYEEAWYSDHQLSEEKKEKALRCLREISGALGMEGGDVRGSEAPAPLR